MKNQEKTTNTGKKITRKEAIKKVGITALATSSFLLLNTQKSQACSTTHTYHHTHTHTQTSFKQIDWEQAWKNFWKRFFG